LGNALIASTNEDGAEWMTSKYRVTPEFGSLHPASAAYCVAGKEALSALPQCPQPERTATKRMDVSHVKVFAPLKLAIGLTSLTLGYLLPEWGWAKAMPRAPHGTFPV
jgi:hypothetical protein